jgi:hypothetical protein
VSLELCGDHGNTTNKTLDALPQKELVEGGLALDFNVTMRSTGNTQLY